MFSRYPSNLGRVSQNQCEFYTAMKYCKVALELVKRGKLFSGVDEANANFYMTLSINIWVIFCRRESTMNASWSLERINEDVAILMLQLLMETWETFTLIWGS